MPRDQRTELPDLDRLADKRSEVRYALNGLVPAVIRDLDGRDLDIVMLDVSRAGLGILAHAFSLRVGDQVNLCVDGQDQIPLIVRWTRSSSLGEHAGLGLTRVGLAVQNSTEDLLERFRPFNCIDQ